MVVNGGIFRVGIRFDVQWKGMMDGMGWDGTGWDECEGKWCFQFYFSILFYASFVYLMTIIIAVKWQTIHNLHHSLSY